MPISFELRDVTFRYDHSVAALDRVSMLVAHGERLALLGANGSGKSTLLRILDGLYFPESGAVSFDGKTLSESALRDSAFQFWFRRRVGLVFQNPDVQLFNPTVFDEVAFGPLQLRWPRQEIIDRVSQTLESLGIAHLKDRAPHRLSGGEKKRVAIASVLVLNPEVLLLDEPTGGLDPKSQSQLMDLLSACSAEGRTIVTATHDLDVVSEIADRCVVLDTGRIAADGPPGDILLDIPLLERSNVIHPHRHGRGLIHSHPHRHAAEGHEH